MDELTEEVRKAARYIVRLHLEQIEYCAIYENILAEDFTGDQLAATEAEVFRLLKELRSYLKDFK